MNLKNHEFAKKAAAAHAVNLIEPDMIIGLGTGSTSSYFIEALGKKVENGLKISAVATSLGTEKKAKECNISLIDINSITYLDLCIDGADEIDSQKQMIKGGGGALLREKIVAHMANEMIVLVDETKVVDHLGKFFLPVEITRFAYKVTMHELEKIGSSIRLRTDKNMPYVTENDNYIADLELNYPCIDPERVNLKIKEIPGVCETGLFLNMAGRVIIGYDDGHIEIRK